MSSNYSRTTQGHTGLNYSLVGAQASKHSSGYGWSQEKTYLPASLIRAQSSEISGGGYTRTHEHANSADPSLVRAQASQYSRDQTWRQNEYTQFGNSLASIHTSEFSGDSYGKKRHMNNSDSTPSIVSARASQFSKVTHEPEVVAEQRSSRVAASATTKRLSRSSRTPARDELRKEELHTSTRTRDELNDDALSTIEEFSYNLGFSGYHG